MASAEASPCCEAAKDGTHGQPADPQGAERPKKAILEKNKCVAGVISEKVGGNGPYICSVLITNDVYYDEMS